MAQAFSKSRFRGLDFHVPSILAAVSAADEQGVSDRVTFDVAAAQDFPDDEYHLIIYFDRLHDRGHPHAQRAIRAGWAGCAGPVRSRAPRWE
jgi:hypothetical protein